MKPSLESDRGTVTIIDVPLLSKVATDRIIAMYVNGELVPGQRLVESELCDRLGVSRSPLREALRNLAADGFVVLEPRRGTVVAPLDSKEAADLYHCRELVQLECVALAVPHLDETAFQELEDAIRELERAIVAAQPYEYFMRLADFHGIVYRRCPNRVLSSIVMDLYRQSFRFRFIAMRESHHLENSLAGQREFLATLRTGDPDTVVAMLRRMIRASLVNVLHGIEQSEMPA